MPQWRRWLIDLLAVSLLVALIVCGAVALARPEVRLSAADADARRTLGMFWAQEHNDSEVYRWAQPASRLRLFGFEQRAPLLLRMRVSASRPADQPLVPLTLPGASLSFPLAREWREYTLLLPAPPHDAEGRLVALEALPDPPYPEKRKLGFALTSLVVTPNPLAFADRLPDPGRLMFLVLLCDAAFVALRRRLARGPALALTLAGALALGAWMLLVPMAAGYWLPNLWVVLALIWLLLLAPPATRALRARLAGDGRALAAGVALLVAAVLLLPLQQGWSNLLGWPALVAAMILLAAALPPAPPPEAEAAEAAPRWLAPALLGITLVALALRLLALGSLPPGLWRDEARHGLLALRILHDPSYRPVYVPNVADIPALLFYLAAVPIGLWGAHEWTIRLVPALAGALTPLALFWMARPLWGWRAALLAAALLAVALWHVALSRLAFAATLGPPLTLLALGAVWRALHAPRPAARLGWAVLAGAATGMSVYAYHPSRLTPLLVALALPVLLGRVWGRWRAALPAAALAVLIACAVGWPLARYAIENRDGFSRRVGQTSVFNPDSLEIRAPLGRLEENLALHLGIWLERGDHIGRHNLPDAPQLDPPTGALFALGLALALAWWRDRRMRLLFLWIAVALVPGLFAIEAPHAVRTVEVIAPSMLLAGIGGVALLDWLRAIRWVWALRWAAPALLAGILLLNGVRYFVVWPALRSTYEQFYIAETHIGNLAQRLARDPAVQSQATRLYVPTGPSADEMVQYLTADLPVGGFDGAALTPAPGPSALLLAYGDNPKVPPERAAQALGPGAQQLAIGPRSPLTGNPEYVLYGLGGDAAQIAQRALASP